MAWNNFSYKAFDFVVWNVYLSIPMGIKNMFSRSSQQNQVHFEFDN